MGRPRKHRDPSTSSGSSVSSLGSAISASDLAIGGPGSRTASDAGGEGLVAEQGVSAVAWDGLGERWGHVRGGHGRQASWAGSAAGSEVSQWSGVSAERSSGVAEFEAGSASGESAWSEGRRGINFDVVRSGEPGSDE